MRRLGVLALAAVLAVSGCGGGKDPAPGATGTTPAATSSPSADPTGTVTATPSGTSAIHFTVDGAGPYQLGATLADLQAAGHLDEVKTGGETCPQNTTARGKGVWKDIRLSFRPDGKLYIAVNRSTTIPTPSGAWLGTTIAGLQSIYTSIGEELIKGTAIAYLVTTGSGRGILFDLDASKKVFAMIAGEASYLKSSYLGGTDYC